jgi:hypothetical protein
MGHKRVTNPEAFGAVVPVNDPKITADMIRSADQWSGQIPFTHLREFAEAVMEQALRGHVVVELPDPAHGYRYGRAWRSTDAEPPVEVTLLRNPDHPGGFDDDLPGPYAKRTPSGGWWFVDRPDEETDPEGWGWADMYVAGEAADPVWLEVVPIGGSS